MQSMSYTRKNSKLDFIKYQWRQSPGSPVIVTRPLDAWPWLSHLWSGVTLLVATHGVSIVGGSRVSTVCGKPKVMGRIYVGRDLEAGQWPWQASLRFQGSHICGAVLINSSWLLSTAHCFLKWVSFLGCQHRLWQGRGCRGRREKGDGVPR